MLLDYFGAAFYKNLLIGLGCIKSIVVDALRLFIFDDP